MRAGTSLVDMGHYNENVVLNAFRILGPTSQRDVANTIDLSAQAVSTIVRSLTERGLLREIRSENLGRGRPRVIMDIVGSARYAIGIHVDPSLMSAVLLNLKGEVVELAHRGEVDGDPHVAVRDMANLQTSLIDNSKIDPSRLVGHCLAMPGPLDLRRQQPTDLLWLPGWTRAPIGDMLSAALNSPVPLIKDTLAAVIGENWVGAGSALQSTMVFVYIGTGTGIGLSIDGDPVRGYSGNFGEIGRMLTLAGADPAASGLASDPAVLVEYAHHVGVLEGPTPDRSERGRIDAEFRTLTDRALHGSERAIRILEASARRISDVAVMTTELVDADLVVFGGPYWRYVERWYAPATRLALDAPSSRGPHAVEVRSSVMDDDVGAIGAAAAVLDNRFAPRSRRRPQARHKPPTE